MCQTVALKGRVSRVLCPNGSTVQDGRGVSIGVVGGHFVEFYQYFTYMHSNTGEGWKEHYDVRSDFGKKVASMCRTHGGDL